MLIEHAYRMQCEWGFTVDYVVYGTGYGATLMLLGYAIRTWGPGWRFRDGEEAAYDRGEFRSAQSSWRRFTVGLGAVVATAGAVLVLLTFLMMLINPGDDLGATIALIGSGLLLVGVAVWAWLFFSRFGAWGIVATPEALISYQPATYDSRAAETSPGPIPAAARGDGDEAGELGEEPADEEPEIGDTVEFEARFSRYELHHPEGEEPEEESDEAEQEEEPDAVEDESRMEAQYSKYESHHPEGEPSSGEQGEEELQEIEEYVETLTLEEVSEDIVDEADEEPVGDDHADRPIETYEDLVGHETAEDPVEDAVIVDPLEVLPEAHEDDATTTGTIEEPRQDAGSREDALRRLRERQAARARQRAADDA